MAALATTGRDERLRSGDGESCIHQATTASPVRRDGVDQRLDRQRAVSFLREAEKNRRQIEKMEKEQTLNALCKKHGWTDVYDELEEYEKILEKERRAQQVHLQKQLAKIQNGVRTFQGHLTDVKPTPQLIEKLKEIMSEVEISINTLKEEQRLCFEEYLKEERTCKQEINAYEKRFENWNLPFKSNSKLPTTSTLKTKLKDRDLPAEVRAVEDFLQRTGGQYGGWEQFDHQAFLKVWTKYNGQPSYRKEAKLYLPGKTLEEIEQHEEWQQELLSLNNKKREAIQRWKASKDQERQMRIQNQEETEEARNRERKAQRLAEQHKTEEERMEVAKQLELWKEEKKRKEEEEEEQRLIEEIHKRRQEKEERCRQLEVKLVLEEHLRLKKEEEEEQERKRREEEQREMEERQREAAKIIKCFSERDLHKVEAKLHEKRLKEKGEEERQKRITAKLKEKVDGRIDRDPSRLIRPTKGWQERMKHIGPSGDTPVLQMFHRAVPTWRQGL
ncbi:coiled-coil domain-containing protein 112 [Nematolebias whitei]|uniref:coiled-coil domain-containing protein 112 n=1 Tax=Nematolebias whitei TaxID=451745 RepID=UPI0018975592|nr:coiled-coil domain-containing protein 112 [Nematolebias whitei]